MTLLNSFLNNRLTCCIPNDSMNSFIKAGMFFLGIIISFPGLQGQTTSDCSGAVVLCGDFYAEENASLNTGDFYEFTGICNANLEQSSVWYTFTVQSDGLLSFVLDPLNPIDDYDWGLFDITTGGCQGIGSQLASPEVGCNSYGLAAPEPNGPTGVSTANGGIGNSNGPGNLNGPAFNADLPVVTGNQYALVVMNWTNSLEGYTIDFGQSTASLYDEVPPQPDSLWVDCTLSEFGVRFDEPVLLSSVDATDFELVAPDASVHFFSSATPLDESNGIASLFSLEIITSLTSSGVYSLFLSDASGSVEDNCGNVGEGFTSLDLTLLEPPISWDLEDLQVCPDEVIGLSVNDVVVQPVATEYSYVWIFEDGMGPQEIGNNLAVESVGDGTYSVEITTIPPCFSATGFFGVVTEECSLNIPNVITPVNGDALNNAFRVDGLENWPGSSVRIFNRWGNLVYTSSDFGSTAGWDPNLDEATEGTYWYELRINRGDDPVSIVQESIETDYPADGNAELLIHGSFALFR
jgi:gliding motility-associated-like protein